VYERSIQKAEGVNSKRKDWRFLLLFSVISTHDDGE
jgi:hypothetical protein